MEKAKKYISGLLLKGTRLKEAKTLTRSKFPKFDMRVFPRLWREAKEKQSSIIIDIDRIKHPPYDLTEDALEIWIKFWQSKQKDIEILSIDHFQLAAYCEEMALYYISRIYTRENGVKYQTDKGNWVQYPEVSIANNAINNAKSIASTMGLSPLARKRLDLAAKETQKGDPFSDVG